MVRYSCLVLILLTGCEFLAPTKGQHCTSVEGAWLGIGGDTIRAASVGEADGCLRCADEHGSYESAGCATLPPVKTTTTTTTEPLSPEPLYTEPMQ